MALPLLEYNEFEFDPESTQVRVDESYEMDSAGRVVVVVRSTMTVDTIVRADDDEDTTGVQLNAMKTILGQNGKRLRFRGWGYADTDVNNGRVKDIDYGPKPKVLSWSPRGFRSAAVRWQVEWALPPCDDSRYELAILEFSYSCSLNKDARGLTSRTINGMLRIPQNNSDTGSTGRLSDDPFNYRDKIKAQIPDNFKRTQFDFDRSADATILHFTIVDQEVDSPNAYPPGVTDIDMTHEVSSTTVGFVTFTGVITATVTMARDYHPFCGFEAILPILRDRLLHAQAQSKSSIVLTNVRFRESIFSYQFFMSVSYQMTSSLRDIIAASGMFRKTPTNWQAWQKSMKNTHKQGGHAQLDHGTQNDVVTNLCDIRDIPSLGQGGVAIPSPSGCYIQIGTEPPSAENSWMGYKNQLLAVTDTGNVVHQPLPDTSQSETVNTEGSDPEKEKELKSNTKPPTLDDGRKGEAVVQAQGTGLIFCQVRGVALRALYPISPPNLKKVGRVRAVELGRKVLPPELVANYGIPVYRSEWVIDYVLKSRPKKAIPVFENPWVSKATTVSGF